MYYNIIKERKGEIVMKLQITFFDNKGQYKPVSTIVEVESIEDYKNNKAKYQTKAIVNICHKRYISPAEFRQQGYTQVKVREYDLFKIDLQKRIKKLNESIDKKKQV